MLLDAALILLAYLTGSVASAVVVCRVMGLPDPRSAGSRNPGATNVLRLGGRKAAALTLAGDVLKGVLPVLLVQSVRGPGPVVAAATVAAFLGHLFPVYFGFRGGKGVATALGAIAAMAWPVGLAMALTWLLVAALFRYSSLASLCAALLAPVYAFWLTGRVSYAAALVVMAGFIWWRHRANVARLLAGTESRIGDKVAVDRKSPATGDTA